MSADIFERQRQEAAAFGGQAWGTQPFIDQDWYREWQRGMNERARLFVESMPMAMPMKWDDPVC